jgi:hypothetical protein
METILVPLTESPTRQGAPARQPLGDRRLDDRFFLGASGLAIVIVALGFGLEFLPGGIRSPRPHTPLVIVHAAVFAGWIILFAVQTSLVAAGRTRLHKRIGIGGVVLALIMLSLGFATAVRAARTGYAPIPGVDPLTFLAVPLGDLVVFASLFGAAVYWRRTADVHKRLVWLATAMLTFPAVTRLPHVRGRVPMIFAIFLALLLGAPIYEWLVRGRAHPVSKWGAIAVFVSVPVRTVVGRTAIWHALATWLIR